jgi:dTDP-4-dehydrorhamnose reductase
VALQRSIPASPTFDLVAFSHADLDIADAEQIAESVRRHAPDLVINAAAYTRVDDAESNAELAARGNEIGPARLAEAAQKAGARLIHVSTDFVFAGDRPVPYRPDDEPAPRSVYGSTKLAGERAVLQALGPRATIVRTSWVYAREGRNFVNTMLQHMRSRESLGVVYDQVGSPTWAASLAAAIWALTARPDVHGIQHWTDEGVASWYDFAVAIQDEALARGLLARRIPVRAIRSAEYPTPAVRPAYSVLDKAPTAALLGLQPAHWRENLRRMFDESAP